MVSDRFAPVLALSLCWVSKEGVSASATHATTEQRMNSMAVVSETRQLTKNELLQAAKLLSTPDLDEFAQEVVMLRAHRKASCLSKTETELLLKINEPRPPAFQKRYKALIRKRDADT